MRGRVGPVARMYYYHTVLLLLYTRTSYATRAKQKAGDLRLFLFFVFSSFVCLKRRTVLRIPVLFLLLLT